MTGTGLSVEVQGEVGDLGIDLALDASAVPLVIVGPNGAGKTTLLMMILGAAPFRRGRILLDGASLCDTERRIDVPVEQRRIGYLPQRYALFPHLDVLDNVAFGVPGGTRAARRRGGLEILADLGVASLASRRPSDLSGGEAQRVALARALARRPRALLLDEPMAALDASIRREVRRFLADRLSALGIPTIIVTHDRADAAAFAGEVAVIERGTVAQRGSLAELSARPATDFVRQFVDPTQAR